MDAEQLRQASIRGCERIVNGPRIFVTREERRVAAGHLRFWRDATADDMARLLARMPAEAPADPPADPVTDAVRQAMVTAARSMRDRAALVAQEHGVIPCHLVVNGISRDIRALPLLDDDAAESAPEAKE